MRDGLCARRGRVWPPVAVVVVGLGALACAGKTPTQPAPTPQTTEAPQGPPVTPPPLASHEPAPGVDPNDPRSGQRQVRRAIFDAAWKLVRDKHFDKTLGGLDWEALRKKYEPLALGAPEDRTFYRFVNEMLGELGQSHFELVGPGSGSDPVFEPERAGVEVLAETKADSGPRGGAARPGLTVRIVEGQPLVSYVEPGSPAERAGLRPGYVVTTIGGWKVKSAVSRPRPLRPVEERFYARVEAMRRLQGPAGTRVTIGFLDEHNRPQEVVVERVLPDGKPVQLGHLPSLYPEVRVNQVGKVGVIAFNLFLTEGLLPKVQNAIDGFRRRGATAIVFDLRGNPGGQGAVAIPIAARLSAQPLTLGTLRFRDFDQTFTASPSIGVEPFLGKVIILTDEGTASTAEIFAAGLKEAGRATIVGESTLGAVLPSQVESLPGGAIMQYVVADFRTPKGVLLEGRGVQPDHRVAESRAALLAGRDPVMDVALTLARAGGKT